MCMFIKTVVEIVNKKTMSRFEAAHKFFANYILAAQFFGAFPVCGITGSHYKLKFKWCSLRTCYALLIICFALFNSGFEVYHKIFSKSRTNLARIGKRIFYVGVVKVDWIILIAPVCYRLICVLLNVLLFRLAMQWHRIIAKWNKLDALTFTCDPAANLNKKVNVLSIVLFITNAGKKTLHYNFK